jgi:hypothetical protein
MMYRWKGVNIDLSSVANIAREFFETQGFKTRIDESENERTVLAVKHVNDESKTFFVKVHGRRDDFYVEFSTSKLGHSLAMLGPLVTLFGFGAVVRKEMNRSDLFRNLEDDFWAYVDDAIAKFEVSKGNPQQNVEPKLI